MNNSRKFLAHVAMITLAIAAAPIATAQAVTAQVTTTAATMAAGEFDWALGTWKHETSEATVIFFVDSDGTLAARIGKLSKEMEKSGFKAGQVVLRGYQMIGTNGISWDFWAGGGEFYNAKWAAGPKESWIKGSVVRIDKGTDNIVFRNVMVDSQRPWRRVGGATMTRPTETGSTETAGKEGTSGELANTTTEEVADSAPPSDDSCVKSYVAALMGDGNRMIAEFENRTRTIAYNDPDFIKKKRYPYQPANVSYDENEQIRGFEKLANEAIKNHGPDTWLRDQRNDIIVFLKSRQTEFIEMARRSGKCPASYTFTESNRRVGQAISEIHQPRLRDLRIENKRVEALREKYTKQLYQKVNSTGTIGSKLDASWENLGYDKTELVALTPQLDRLNEKYAKARKEGKPVTSAQMKRDMIAAFRAAGVPYRDDKAEAALMSGLEGSLTSTLNTVAEELAFAGKGSVLGKIQPLTSTLMNLGEIFNAIFDLGTLNSVSKNELPLTLTLTEDAAHLYVMIRRYELFYEEWEAFRNKYNAFVNSRCQCEKAM